MKHPRRWLDSPGVPEDIAVLLRSQRRPMAMPPGARERGRMRVARLAAVPAGAVASWLSLKSAAAFALAGGLAAGGAVALTQGRSSTSSESSTASHSNRSEGLQRAGGVPSPSEPASEKRPEPRAVEEAPSAKTMRHDLTERAPPEQVPNVQRGRPSTRRRAKQSVKRSAPSSSGTTDPLASVPPRPAASPLGDQLALEAALLERARATLASDPAAALVVARQHEREFPRGQLVLERQLVEMDALAGLGQMSAARAVAIRILASRPGALYTERVQARLRKLDQR